MQCTSSCVQLAATRRRRPALAHSRRCEQSRVPALRLGASVRALAVFVSHLLATLMLSAKKETATAHASASTNRLRGWLS